MTIYLDLVFFINFFFDLILLMTLKIILKRNTSLYRILLGTLIGSSSIIFLFMPINSLQLFILKIIVSILMLLTSFGFKDFKYFSTNFLYLYFISILLGGFLYYLKLEFNYILKGTVFASGYVLNYILLIFISPLILYLYLKQLRSFKNTYNNYYQVEITYNKKKYNYTGFIDSGNHLYDLYKKRPIILLHDQKFKLKKDEKIIYTPYETLNNKGVIKCIKVDKLLIDNIVVKDVLVGISNDKFKLDGVDLILHAKIFN